MFVDIPPFRSRSQVPSQEWGLDLVTASDEEAGKGENGHFVEKPGTPPYLRDKVNGTCMGAVMSPGVM